jgi:hypothetical protein
MAFRVEVQWPLAYLADGSSGLIIFDISNPENPEEIGSYDIGETFDVAVSGFLAFAVTLDGDIYMLDITDPTTPSRIDSFALGVETYSLEVDGNYLYTAGMAGLSVFEITQAGTINPIGNYLTAGCIDLEISGDHAFATGIEGLTVFDISDPANPDSVGGLATGGYLIIIGSGLSGNMWYVTTEPGDLGAVDVTDPENIMPGNAASLPGFGMFMDIAGDYAYAAYGMGLAVVDIINPMDPQLIYAQDISNEVLDADVAGEYVYVAAGADGLLILRAAQPVMPPLPAGNAAISTRYRGIAVEGNSAFISSATSGVRTMDITDPANPYQLGGYSTGGYVHSIEVCGNLAYVADGDGDFKILDITNPGTPSLLGSYPTIGIQDNDVAVTGDYAFVADYTEGMYIFDVSDPANPDSIGFYGVSNVAWGVEAAWPIVYLANGSVGLSMIDVGNPSSPNLIDTYNTPGEAMDVVVEGGIAFIADGFEGIHIVDVFDPSQPNLVVSYDTPDFAAEVAVDLPFIYVADRDSGVQVLELTETGALNQVANIPTADECRSVAVAGDILYYGVDFTGFFSTQVWERTHDIENNIAQSTVMHTSAQVDRIKLDAVPADSIVWEASADNGANWEVLPLGAWHDLTYPGSDLILRAALQYEAYHHYPVCDSMAFELEAGIVSVLITNIEAAAEGSGISVKWNVAADENIRGFNLYRTGHGGGPAGPVNGMQLIPADQRKFSDLQVRPGVLYEYRLGAVKQDGREVMSRPVTAKVKVHSLALEQNYPNPFNPSTTISYSLPERMRVRIAIYNPEGKLVKLLADGIMSGGLKTVGWNGTDAAGTPVASGVYFYQLKAGAKTFTRKMMLLK